MAYVDLRPDHTRQVWLAVDDDWVLAELQAYRAAEDGAWEGWVRWHIGLLQRIDWVPADRIRRGVWVG